ncbi:hypothetical protein KDL45_07070 [bacterium]|nr:hypothetical protein [bacterium]MCB9479486.1 hypothetical protein [Deltaproteobacteria bacterium]
MPSENDTRPDVPAPRLFAYRDKIPAWRYWAIFAGFVLLSVIAAVLLLPVSETQVDLAVDATHMRFDISEARNIVDELQLSHVEIWGLTRIAFPRRIVDESAANLAGMVSTSDSISLSTITDDDGEAGRLQIREIPINPNTRVVVRRGQMGDSYGLAVAGNRQPLKMQVVVSGPVEVTVPGKIEAQTIDFGPVARAFALTGLPDGVNWEFDLAPGTVGRMADLLTVHDVRFEYVIDYNNLKRATSSIRAGSVSFRDVNHRAYEIRPGELLRLGGADGILRTVSLDPADAGLTVEFQGRVTDVSAAASPDHHPRTQMPSWVELFWAHYRPVVLFCALLMIFAQIAWMIYLLTSR